MTRRASRKRIAVTADDVRRVVLGLGAAGLQLPLPSVVLLEGLARAGHVSDLYFDHATRLVVVAVPDNDAARWAETVTGESGGGVAFVRRLKREPDRWSNDHTVAVWYGPTGKDAAIEVWHRHGDTFRVLEYRDVGGQVGEFAAPDARPVHKRWMDVEAAGFRDAATRDVWLSFLDEEMVRFLP